MNKNARLWLTLWRNAYEYSGTVECHEMSNSGLWHACSNLALSKSPINIRPGFWGFLQIGNPPNLLVDHHVGITSWDFPSQHRHLCGKNVLRIFRHSRHHRTARYRCACHAQHQTYPVKGLQPSLQEDDWKDSGEEQCRSWHRRAGETVRCTSKIVFEKKNLENRPFTQDTFYIFIIFPVKDVQGILWSREQCWTPRGIFCAKISLCDGLKWLGVWFRPCQCISVDMRGKNFGGVTILNIERIFNYQISNVWIYQIISIIVILYILYYILYVVYVLWYIIIYYILSLWLLLL